MRLKGVKIFRIFIFSSSFNVLIKAGISFIMRYVISAIAFMMILTAVCATSEGVTPYGDYSQWCSAYGICKEDLGPQEAENIIERYFASKGLTAANIRHKGRFIEVDIYRNNRPFDKVLFDRKTGRIRSTY